MRFKSPEHALGVTYYILSTRIEPSTSLQKIIKEYEEIPAMYSWAVACGRKVVLT